MTSSHRATARPFTVALCTACRSPVVPAVLEHLRATVRRCDQGLLVTTGCLLGELTCLVLGDNNPGAVLMLQPCTIDRVARGSARWIGPICNTKDLRIVCAWLERGEWASDQLPVRLRLDLSLNRRAIATN
jgi:hypothetical protein